MPTTPQSLPPTPQNTAPTLLWGATPADLLALQQALHDAGLPPGVPVHEGAALVQQAAALAPQQVILHAAQPQAAWLPALAPWRGAPPCAVCAITPALSPEHAAAGVVAWWPELSAPLLPAQLRYAQALHAQQQALAGQLDDRKWVDRAKGLLMAARQLPEDDAFKLLRGAAMQANLKLVDVSRAVVDAARWAEAVNRAGQLRMLSQRLVALAAQRLAKLEAATARGLAQQALARLQDNVRHLVALSPDAAAVQRHGGALAQALAGKLDAAGLARADAEAGALLQAADALAQHLQAQGGRRTLAIVNLCGSQRMRVQRLVKDALLAKLLPAGAAERSQRAQATMDEFEAVQRQVAEAPLSSPEIRASLAAAQDGWLALLRAWRTADGAALVHAGEHLLATLERLTEQCERSLQVLMA